MIRRPPRSTRVRSSAASDVYKRQVIWEEGRVAALSHTYAVKSPLVTMACPKFVPKSTPFRGLIPKPHYVPHPWTRPTYDAKRHPDLIRCFSTMPNVLSFKKFLSELRGMQPHPPHPPGSATGLYFILLHLLVCFKRYSPRLLDGFRLYFHTISGLGVI